MLSGDGWRVGTIAMWVLLPCPLQGAAAGQLPGQGPPAEQQQLWIVSCVALQSYVALNSQHWGNPGGMDGA